MLNLNRREFLQGSAALAGAAALGGVNAIQAAQQRGSANDRLRVAVIGVKGRGNSHVSGFAGRHNCIVTHICDCDEGVINRAMRSAAGRDGNPRPTYVKDLRRIMDNPNIDIVSIATPNHWHSLAAIWAIQSGKHVYVEKPVSHNVWEGRRLVEVARHHNKACQAGTQIRSSRGVQQAIAWLHAGNLGRVKVARGLCYKPRGSIGQVGPQGGEIPNSIDYSLWCGPGPEQRPMQRRRLHYDWHWTWDFGNGDLGNQGIHQMDIARWGLNESTVSPKVFSLGGRFGYEDDGQTANTQMCVFDYGQSQLIFEVRGLRTNAYKALQNIGGAKIGIIFHCENGIMVIPSYASATAYNLDGEVVRRFNGGGDHFGDLVAAIRSGRHQDLNGEIYEGHISSALCHLGNISYRLGQATPWNRARGGFQDNEAASETFERMRSHLSDNNVPVNNGNCTVGPVLNLNPQTERFLNHDRANQLLTRNYRRGFEVPTQNS